MSKRIQDQLESGNARLVAAPVQGPAQAQSVRHQVEVDRNFELPASLFKATVGLYLAFLGVMFAGFGGPELIIPMAIFAVFIVAGFGVPAIWPRLKGNRSAPMTMGKFKQAGIMTATGPVAPRDAVIQMLILPVLIVIWGCVAAIIAALV